MMHKELQMQTCVVIQRVNDIRNPLPLQTRSSLLVTENRSHHIFQVEARVSECIEWRTCIDGSLYQTHHEFFLGLLVSSSNTLE